jgi:hypothetical protein
MQTLSRELIAEAVALANAKGADLLVQLGNFGVWHGELATMRGDDPRTTRSNTEAASHGADFQEAFVVAKAIELLTADCRSAFAAGHMPPECMRRLGEIYESLVHEHSAR